MSSKILHVSPSSLKIEKGGYHRIRIQVTKKQAKNWINFILKKEYTVNEFIKKLRIVKNEGV